MALKDIIVSNRSEEDGEQISLKVKGDKVKGFYRGTVKLTSKQGDPFNKHLFETDEGRVHALSSMVNLDKALAKVTPGVYVEIENTGKTRLPNGQTPHQFKVRADDERTIEVA